MHALNAEQAKRMNLHQFPMSNAHILCIKWECVCVCVYSNIHVWWLYNDEWQRTTNNTNG